MLKNNSHKKNAVKRTCFKDPNDKALQETQTNVNCWEETTSNQTGNRSCPSKGGAWTMRRKAELYEAAEWPQSLNLAGDQSE